VVFLDAGGHQVVAPFRWMAEFGNPSLLPWRSLFPSADVDVPMILRMLATLW